MNQAKEAAFKSVVPALSASLVELKLGNFQVNFKASQNVCSLRASSSVATEIQRPKYPRSS